MGWWKLGQKATFSELGNGLFGKKKQGSGCEEPWRASIRHFLLNGVVFCCGERSPLE